MDVISAYGRNVNAHLYHSGTHRHTHTHSKYKEKVAVTFEGQREKNDLKKSFFGSLANT